MATTEKIRVTVTTKEVKELEISFPYYTRDNGLYLKFFNRREVMWISDYLFKNEIKYSNFGAPESWLTFDPITEEEFNAKFKEVMDNLIKMNNEKAI